MNWLQAAAWGLTGGLTSGLVTLMAQIRTANYCWPWKRCEVGPRLVVFVCGLVVGAIVVAAAHKEMTGEWPAFIMGICAPTVIRRVIEGIEVHPKVELPTGTGLPTFGIPVPVTGLPQEEQASETTG